MELFCDNDTSGLTSLTGRYDFPDSKYYDTYAYATVDEQYQRRILGDATGEMGPFANATSLTQTKQIGSWLAEHAYFVLSNNPWFYRGAAFTDGTGAGMFAFEHAYGTTNNYASFRLILTP